MSARFALSVLFFSWSLCLWAQGTATIRGEVIEKGTNDLLPGVNVFIEGTTIGSSSNIDGQYEIKNVPEGTIRVVSSFMGYEPVIKEISVLAGQTVTLNFEIAESSQLLNEVNIVAERATATENAVLLEMKEAKQLVSGISRQQMVRSQDSDAAKVMQRVPGVTIVGNRFIMIRGVSERYNQVMINGVIAPSTEVDRRTFSFDLIQSNTLDRMVINKTGSPEFPGDFAGGVIKIYTINQVEEPFTTVNVGMGVRLGTTFNDFYQSAGSNTDFLGFDNSFRPLPDNFPSTRIFQNLPRNAPLREEAGRTLPNNWRADSRVASPDYSMGFALGRNIKLGGQSRLISTNSLAYSRSFMTYRRDFFRYDAWEDQSQPIDKFFAFDDDIYEEETTVSAMSNWAYVINSRHKIQFNNLFNQIGEQQTIERNGINFFRPTEDRRDYLLGFRSRSIYTGQLQGDHDLSPNDKLHWVIGSSFLGESEPDLRRFRTFRERSESGENNGPFTMQLPPSSNLFDTGRYFGELAERGVNNGIDYTRTLKETPEGKMEISAGTYVDYRTREFSSRYFSFLYPGFSDPTIGQALSQLPLDQIFAPDNIRAVNGFVLEEGTRPIDSYTASNFLTAGYVSATVPLGKWNLSGGIRLEHNVQRMDARDDFEDIVVEYPLLSFLPSINATYALSKNSLLRGGYSRTINRPEFRELAPFLFYDYILDAGRAGNPDLVVADIDNFDLRYELYPRLGEVISLGAFYKRFTNPIENITIITTEQPQFTYANAVGAENFGVEMEFRKSFKNLTQSRFVDRFSANLNASYIWSQVDLGIAATNQDRVRPLQGQSPYIINAGLTYTDNLHKFAVTAYYNIFGDRIFAVGDVLFPTIYELPRHSVDLTITKDLGKRLALKAGVRDLLNARYRFVQDSNRDGKITDVDDTIFSFQQGQLISLSLAFKLQ